MGDATKTEDPWYPDDSGAWVEHDGSGMPVDGMAMVAVLTGAHRRRRVPPHPGYPLRAISWDWDWFPYPGTPSHGDIVAYRRMEDRT